MFNLTGLNINCDYLVKILINQDYKIVNLQFKQRMTKLIILNYKYTSIKYNKLKLNNCTYFN